MDSMGSEEYRSKSVDDPFLQVANLARPKTALAFLNAPPLSQHHSLLLPTSIYITPALEWRLAGFEVLSGKDDPQGVAWAAGLGVGLAPGGIGERIAPEVKKAGWSILKESVDVGVIEERSLTVILLSQLGSSFHGYIPLCTPHSHHLQPSATATKPDSSSNNRKLWLHTSDLVPDIQTHAEPKPTDPTINHILHPRSRAGRILAR
jgi:hypothetical protein